MGTITTNELKLMKVLLTFIIAAISLTIEMRALTSG
jgi:hypothetical protein